MDGFRWDELYQRKDAINFILEKLKSEAGSYGEIIFENLGQEQLDDGTESINGAKALTILVLIIIM